MSLILGIDPGSVRIGYGLIKKQGSDLHHIQSGILKIPAEIKKEQQLYALEVEIKQLVTRHHPDRIGIEKLFFVRNQKTAIEVAQARGVILSAIAELNLPFKEFTPTEVKQAITGNGNAPKSAVARMVRMMIKGDIDPHLIDDASDALAIAIIISGIPQPLWQMD